MPKEVPVKTMTLNRCAHAAGIGLCATTLALVGACGNRNEYHPPPPPAVSVSKQNAPSQANVEKWQSQRDQAAAAVTLAKINLAYTHITAPFDGRIGRHLVDPGNLVGAMGSTTKLATIEQVSPIYVYFSVNE